MACEHCALDENDDAATIGSWKSGFYIDREYLRSQGEYNCARIYYCPMCGERLGGDAE